MSNSQGQGQVQVQTFGQAESSITEVVQSSFTSLAKMLGIPQLKESFYQNIIYIFHGSSYYDRYFSIYTND